jgi:hypothetical protein
MTPVDFGDPSEVRLWLAALETVTQDLIAAAEDQVRPPGERDLGRRAASLMIEESASVVESMLRHARASLVTNGNGDPSGNGGAGPH